MTTAEQYAVGERLQGGRYVVRGMLGSGTQGQTLIAWDERDARELALKRFRVRGAARWKDVELAEREAAVLATLEHPGLPRYFGHFEEDGCLYLAMARIEGENLASFHASGGVFTTDDVWRFLADSAKVLDYLHARVPPIIHRDIKPANVIRRPDGHFVLVDFGSVQHRLRPQGGSTVAGTFGYMAPEQLHGRALPATDVYAVGATAMTLLTGHEPEDLPHRGLTIDVARALGKAADRRLVSALGAMLEADPERRASSIDKALAGRRQRSRRRVGVAVSAIAATLAIGAGTWAIARARHHADPASEQEAREHWVHADFSAASRALARGAEDSSVTPSVIAAYLMGSDPARAAAASRKLAPEQSPALATTLLCLADALDARRGDRDARARLEAASEADQPDACRLLLADLETGADRLRHVAPLRIADETWNCDDRWAEALLAFEADPSLEPPLPHFYPMDQLLRPHEFLMARPLGLELGLRWRNPEGLLLRALFESYLGDHAAAARALREALQAAGVRGNGGGSEPGNLFEYRLAGSAAQRLPFRHFFFLGAVLAARARETRNARVYVELAPEETNGRRALLPFLAALEGSEPPRSGLAQYDPAELDLALWRALDEKSPAAIGATLRKQHSIGLAVLPFAPPAKVQTPELRQWAETALPPVCWGCTPQNAFRQIVESRRIAQSVGSVGLESELEARVERIRTALTRRDIAIPLYLLARLEP